MKKYGKFIVVGICTVLLLTIFLIDASKISAEFPQFKIEKKVGNDEVLDKLSLRGSLEVGSYFYNESFKVNKSGTTYLRDEGYFTDPNKYNLSDTLLTYREKYRSFMRGKFDADNLYFENEEYVAYVDVPYSILTTSEDQFLVDILHKESKKSNQFMVKIPNWKNYWNVEILHVKLVDDRLYVFTNNIMRNTSTLEGVEVAGEQIVVYTIDVEKKVLIDEESIILYDFSDPEDGYTIFGVILNNEFANEEILIYGIEVNYDDYIEEELYYEETVRYVDKVQIKNAQEKATVSQLTKYNINTKQKEVVPLPEGDQLGVPVMFTDNEVVFLHLEKDRLVLQRMNIDNAKIIKTSTIPMEGIYLDVFDVIHRTEVKDNQIYYVTEYYDWLMGLEGPSVIVIELETLSASFIGQVVSDEEDLFKKNMYYNIFEAELK